MIRINKERSEKRVGMWRKQEGARTGLTELPKTNATSQQAIAKTSVQMNRELYESLQRGALHEASVLENARAAGTLAAKKTSSVLPYCHFKPLTAVAISFDWKVGSGVWELLIEAEVKARHAATVDSEALMAATVTALAVFDSCKSISQSIVLGPCYLSRKRT